MLRNATTENIDRASSETSSQTSLRLGIGYASGDDICAEFRADDVLLQGSNFLQYEFHVQNFQSSQQHFLESLFIMSSISDQSSYDDVVEQKYEPPPDGGYGWVCVAACFIISCFTWGVVSVRRHS